MKSKHFSIVSHRRPSRLGAFTSAGVLILAGTLIIAILASGSYAIVAVANGVLGGNAKVVTADGASGGKAVQFGAEPSTPAPTPASTGSGSPGSSPGSGGVTSNPVPTVVMGFDEAGVSTGLGNDYTAAQWSAIKAQGFEVFITDPIDWSSECSDGSCTAPVNTCTVDAAAVAQIQDAYNVGMDYAVYTRNPNCLTKAIQGLGATLAGHLSFAVLDIETDPGVKLTQSMVSAVTALGQTPVIYSYQGAWQQIMGNSTAFASYPLQDAEVANWSVSFPAPYPFGFPRLVAMPNPYGNWTGTAPKIEQVQANAEVGGIDNASDAVDLDAVDNTWIQSLPHHF